MLTRLRCETLHGTRVVSSNPFPISFLPELFPSILPSRFSPTFGFRDRLPMLVSLYAGNALLEAGLAQFPQAEYFIFMDCDVSLQVVQAASFLYQPGTSYL